MHCFAARPLSRRHRALVLAGPLLLAACAGDPPADPEPEPGLAQPAAPEASATGSAPPVWPVSETQGPEAAAPNPLATLRRTLVDEGRKMELLAGGLRPDERMVAARLVAPDGRSLSADPQAIRRGRRYAGGPESPRIGLHGGSDRGVGVTFSLDLFGDRSPPPAPVEGASAWVEIALPAEADPAAWRAEALIEDSFGQRYVLTAR